MQPVRSLVSSGRHFGSIGNIGPGESWVAWSGRGRKFVALILAVTAVGFVKPCAAVGLVGAFRDALANDPAVLSARFENAATLEGVPVARASLLPSVSLGYSTNKNTGEVERPGVPSSPTEYTSRQFSLSVRQPLYNREAYVRYRQSATQAEFSDSILQKSLNDLALRLSSTYLEALLTQEQLALARAQQEAMAEARSRAKRLFEKGEGTRTDLLEAEARHAIAQTQALDAELNFKARRDALGAIIGSEPDVLEGVREADTLSLDLAADVKDLERRALDANPDIIAQRKRLAYAEDEIERNRAGHLPRVDLVASQSRGLSESIYYVQQQTTISSIGVQVSVPLYSGGGVNAQTSQASARYESARADLDKAIRATLVEVRRQFDAVSNGLVKIASVRKSEAAALEVVSATRKSVAGGQRINLDILNATQQLFSVRRDLAEASYAYLLAFLRLSTAVGSVGERELSLIAGPQFAAD